MMTEIRSAVVEDAGEIAAIYAPYVLTSTATFEIEAPDAVEIVRRMSGVLSLGLPYLVAEVDGEIAGYGYAGRFRPREAYRFTAEDTVYLRPEFAGRGLGRLLLSELIARARAAGIRQMVAVIGGENPASVRLHRALGFADAGVLRGVGYKFGEWLDVMMMQREL
jgi:L-amino acid N-acyltransferase YncA